MHARFQCKSRRTHRWALVLLLLHIFMGPVTFGGPVVDDFAANGYISARVHAIAPDSSGRIFLGGDFLAINGEGRGRLARLLPSGALDSIYYYLNADLNCFAIQSDGKVLLGGAFQALNGVTHRRIARLNVDGSVDESFTTNLNGTVNTIAVDSQDRILIGGYFSSVNGSYTGTLARLNSDGTLDSSFQGVQGAAPAAYVSSINIRTDGRILIAGYFQRVAGVVRDGVALLEPNGILNTAFNPRVNGEVYGAAMYEDGRLILYGSFLSVNGVFRDGVARLNADGSLDLTFNPNPNGSVVGATIAPDGSVWIIGMFTFVAADTPSGLIGRRRTARYLANGSLDDTFNLGSEEAPFAMSYQDPSRLLIGGSFDSYGGQSRSKLVRLYETIATADSLLLRGSTITWRRGANAAALAAPPVLSVSVSGGPPTRIGRFTWDNGAWTIRNIPRAQGAYRYMVAARVASSSGNGSSSVADAESPEYLFRADFEP
ncbi:delta-60 repeat domain-containing protein [Tahibacter harae]|uniref:Delta-60 repeat domain-containing protein n=1 Tax=Tahibacter harae TaxID=2963937 RepID=A0ABT1QWL0_9GAMM|nr:delta-60 repeat domain-containing protein [Tahibacter harae]MCQ4166680.1 delta-60 repeat domain-containing protein [Tahibacter harae]